MKAQEHCPFCGAELEAEQHLIQRVSGPLSLLRVWHRYTRVPLWHSNHVFLETAHVAECPYCGHAFLCEDYKFFGLFSHAALQRFCQAVLAVFVAFCTLTALALIIGPLLFILRSW